MVIIEFYSDTNRGLAEDRLRALGLDPLTCAEGLLLDEDALSSLHGPISDVVHEFGGNIPD